IVLGRLLILKGDLAGAEAALQEGRRELKEGLAWLLPILLPLGEGELALAQRDAPRALAVLDGLLDYLQRTRARPFFADGLHLKSQALLALGREIEAYEMLQRARAEAEAIGSRRRLWPTLLTLSQMEARRGRLAETEALRARAREITGYIADHCPPEARAAFLNLSAVKSVAS
ncbi:MAG: hypothetical protein ACRDH2_08995, partial [Anaerolineales bacterium]